jgi:hypothetical protein
MKHEPLPFPPPAWRGRVPRQGRERVSFHTAKPQTFCQSLGDFPGSYRRFAPHGWTPSPAPAGAPSPPKGARGKQAPHFALPFSF